MCSFGWENAWFVMFKTWKAFFPQRRKKVDAKIKMKNSIYAKTFQSISLLSIVQRILFKECKVLLAVIYLLRHVYTNWDLRVESVL